MRCPNCRARSMEDELYCRQCGADLLVSTSTSLIPVQMQLPAVLQNPVVSRTVVAGVGAVALGVGLELLRRSLLSRLTKPNTVRDALPILRGLKDILFPQKEKPVKPPKGRIVQETVIYVRQITRR